MKSARSSKLFMGFLLLLIAITLLATLHFFNEINNNYILMYNGNEPLMRVLNPYKYIQAKKGLIFSLSMLISTFSLGIMVILPNEEDHVVQFRQAKKTKTVQQPEKSTAGQPSEGSSGISAEVTESAPMPPNPMDSKKTKKEVDIELIDTEEIFDEDNYHEVTEGEDDVVYGAGDITNRAIMDFVHKFPDSSLKFLFRKQLDGKPLTNEEEEIYLGWENRGMTRGKVKAYIMTLMDWDVMPKEALFDTWKKMRDHIFENIA
ncbi:MAG: hypothetical protein QNL04_11070 [SAR324 cluster bacterium]|nr:hypothetical protein [SAR324 cluster bacterium]